jgi:hypothetical protein
MPRASTAASRRGVHTLRPWPGRRSRRVPFPPDSSHRLPRSREHARRLVWGDALPSASGVTHDASQLPRSARDLAGGVGVPAVPPRAGRRADRRAEVRAPDRLEPGPRLHAAGHAAHCTHPPRRVLTPRCARARARRRARRRRSRCARRVRRQPELVDAARSGPAATERAPAPCPHARVSVVLACARGAFKSAMCSARRAPSACRSLRATSPRADRRSTRRCAAAALAVRCGGEEVSDASRMPSRARIEPVRVLTYFLAHTPPSGRIISIFVSGARHRPLSSLCVCCTVKNAILRGQGGGQGMRRRAPRCAPLPYAPWSERALRGVLREGCRGQLT